MGRVRVATESEFKDGSREFVTVDGREIGVLLIDGSYYALSNTCPHQGGPVAQGTIRRPITADVPEDGERIEERYESEGQVIRCPCHGWGFYIETGENLADSEHAPGIPVYDVVVDDGVVYVVETPSNPQQ